MNDVKICFVVTNYNNSNYSKLMIDSLEKISLSQVDIVIVDNASKQEELLKLDSLNENANSNIYVIKNSKNVGYFEGLNIGIRYAREQLPIADYYVIGNNDLVFPQDFAKQLESCDDVLKKYPVVSPNIRMLDGTPQNPHVISAISKKREFIYDLYHSSYTLAGLITKVAKLTHKFTDRKDEQQHEVAQEIYQGYGACYIIGEKFFEEFGELWSPTFLMYEEFFLSKQLEEKGYKTYYEPRIMMTHHCHASTSTLPGRYRWQLCKDAHKEYRKYVKVWR